MCLVAWMHERHLLWAHCIGNLHTTEVSMGETADPASLRKTK